MLLLTAACGRNDEDSAAPLCVPDAERPADIEEFGWFGPALGDGLEVELDYDCAPYVPVEVWLHGEASSWVELTRDERCAVRWTLPASVRVVDSWTDLELRWRDDPLSGDMTQWAGVDGYLEAQAPWGLDPAFEPTVIDGGAFLIDADHSEHCPNGIGELLLEFLPGGMWLEIREATHGHATFRLIQEVPDLAAGACVYVEGGASLSNTGQLAWKRNHLTLSTDPVLEAYNLALEAGFDATGTAVAGVSLHGTIDLASGALFGSAEDWQDTCNLVSALDPGRDDVCEPCFEDGRASCWTPSFWAAHGERQELPWDSDTLPDCNVLLDVDLDVPDCGCASRSGHRHIILGLLLAPLVLLTRARAPSQTHPRALGSARRADRR